MKENPDQTGYADVYRDVDLRRHPKLSLKGLPRSVRAGATLALHLHLAGGTGTVTATLTHRKTLLAKASQRRASGDVTLKLRLGRNAKRGPANLTVRGGGAEPVVARIAVTGPHR